MTEIRPETVVQALVLGNSTGIAAPAESAAAGSRQLAHDEVIWSSIMSRMASLGTEPSMITVFQ